MFMETLESRRLYSVVTLTADTTQVLTLHSGETLDGNGHTVGGLKADDVSNVSVNDLRVKGKTGSGINIYSDTPGISGLTLNDVTISGFSSGYGLIIDTGGQGTYSNIYIYDVTAFNNGIAGIATYGNVGSITQFSLLDSIAYDNPGIHNSGTPSGSGIMVAGLNGGVIENCQAYGNGANNNSPDGPVGIFAYSSNDVVISDCYSHNNTTQINDGGGFDLDGGVTNSEIIDCVSSNNFGYGYAAFTYAGGGPNSGNSFIDNTSTGDKEGFVYWSNGPAITDLTVSGNTFLNPTSGDAIVGGAGSAYGEIVLTDNTYSASVLIVSEA
ncbi:MAG TPA: hypothetical protein VMD30_07720 [Tepidisphaeraceae bacterium]|nr:hypothetical protein [Tepidisphaeraceae bacterium]